MQRRVRPGTVELIRASLPLVALRQRTCIDVNPPVQSDSRSCRISTSLGTFNFGIEARNALREGIVRCVCAGRILARGFPLRVTTTSPSFPRSSSRCESADLTCRIFRVFIDALKVTQTEIMCHIASRIHRSPRSRVAFATREAGPRDGRATTSQCGPMRGGAAMIAGQSQGRAQASRFPATSPRCPRR
jgi:hypothetical protein